MNRSPLHPINRRRFFGVAAGSAAFLGGAHLVSAAQDFWNKKSHDKWSSQEIRQLATRSPWAKDARVDLKTANRGGYNGGAGRPDNQTMPGSDVGNGMSQRRMAGGDMGGIDAGAPGIPQGGTGRELGADPGLIPDAMGGQRGADGIPISAMAATVRWESAQPIMEALGTTLPPQLADRYVISVSGIPALQGKAFEKGDEDMVERLKASATLQVKGKPPAQAGVVQRSATGMWFGFAKEFVPLTAADRDVTFTLNTAQLNLKARFDPKEMIYNGKLAV